MKRIDGRAAASQIASASTKSFLLPLTKGQYELRRDELDLVPEGGEFARHMKSFQIPFNLIKSKHVLPRSTSAAHALSARQ
jgi:hypothetical protein